MLRVDTERRFLPRFKNRGLPSTRAQAEGAPSNVSIESSPSLPLPYFLLSLQCPSRNESYRFDGTSHPSGSRSHPIFLFPRLPIIFLWSPHHAFSHLLISSFSPPHQESLTKRRASGVRAFIITFAYLQPSRSESGRAVGSQLSSSSQR
jgi:hypothetical protein